MPGVGRLDIGIGEGAAQVFDPHPAIQQYGQILAQRQAKHDQEVKMLGDELAKGYDPTVLRNDADRQQYLKKYGDIKTSAIQAENEKDPTKKALALAQVRQQLTDLGAWAEGSKKQGVFERQVAMEHFKNPYMLDDNSAQQLKSQMQKPWDDPGTIKDVTGFERGVDPAKIDAEYQKHKDMILKGSSVTYDNGVLSPVQNILGKKMATLTQNRIVPFQDAYEHTLNYATADANYQKYLHDKYPQIVTDDPKTTLALRVRQDMIARGDDKGFYDKPKTREVEGYKPQDPVRPSFDDIQYYNKYGTWPVKNDVAGQSNTPTYRQKLVGDILDGVLESGEQLQAKIAADPSYAGNLKIEKGTGRNVAGQIAFTIPPKRKWDNANSAWVETAPARTVWIDPKDKNAKIKLNEMINEVTGEKVDISALETPGGKKHVGVPVNQTYKATDGKSYSHKDLLKMGYTEQQIEEAKKLGTLK